MKVSVGILNYLIKLSFDFVENYYGLFFIPLQNIIYIKNPRYLHVNVTNCYRSDIESAVREAVILRCRLTRGARLVLEA